MPLQKQIVPYNIGVGIETKDDPKQDLVGKLSALNNGRFISPKKIIKRNGYGVLSNSVLGGGTITNGVNIASYNSELIVTDGLQLYSYTAQQSEFTNRGSFVSCALDAQKVVRNNNQQTSQDSCYHSSGVQLFAWEDSSGGVQYSVIDTVTGQFIVSNQLLSLTASQPKCITIGNNLVLIYFESSNSTLRYRAVNSATPNIASAAVTLASDIVASPVIYDATLISTSIFFAYNAATGIGINTLNTSLTVGSETIVTTEVASGAINVFGDSSNNVWVCYYNGTAVKGLIRSFTLTSVLTARVIETPSGFTIRNITGIISTGTTATILYEVVSTTANYNAYIRSNTLTLAGTVGTASNLIRSVGLASKVFSAYGGFYVLTTYDSPLQPSYFVINLSGLCIAKISPQEGGGLTKKSILPEVNLLGTNMYQISYLQRDTVQVDDGTVVSNTGLMRSKLTFGLTATKVTAGNNLIIGGALVTEYDGVNIVEQGYNYFPETPTATYVGFGGGLTIGDQYQYVSTYEWVDNQGQIHRSAASIAVTVDVIANASNLQFRAAATSGSPFLKNTITGTGIAKFPAYYGYIGMQVSGTGIPTGTTIIAIDNTNGWTMSANATSTATVIGSITPQFLLTPAAATSIPITGTNTFFITPVEYFPVYGSMTSSSTVVNIYDTSYIAVGMSLSSGYDTTAGSTITNINGTVVTVSSGLNVNAVSPANTSFAVTIQWSGTTTSGSGTVGNIPAAVIPNLYVGQTVNSTSFAIPVLITAIGSTSITVSGSATATTTATTFAYFGPNQYLKVGQQVAGTGLLANANITALTTTSITVDQNFTAEPTGTYTLPNVIMGVVTVPTLRVTAKQNVRIVIYRTQANGTIFFRSSPLVSPFLSSTTVDTIAVGDHYPDLYIIGNDQLYTTGGTVDNIGVPASNIIFADQNRLVVVPSENTSTFWYSQEVVPGDPIEMSDQFVQNIDQRGGGITAGYQRDDLIILFKNYTVSYVAGEGPAPNGTSNDFTNAILISSDTGCVNQNSIVITPDGLMFQSPKGIYLLDRNNALTYIGADVEAFNSSTVTSAQLVTNTNEVRFTLNSGIILVYDYFVNQWAVDQNLAAVDSVLWNGNFVFLTSAGIVNQETVGTFTDNGNFIPLSLTSSWISFGGIQGFQRVYKMLIVGDYFSPHQLQVQMSSNFRSNLIDQTSVITASAPLANGQYQYRVFMQQQKCESVQFTLTELQTSPFGEGLDLSTITFEMGIKQGAFPLGAALSVG